MWRWLCVLLASCGRIEFDPTTPAGDARAPDTGLTIDGNNVAFVSSFTVVPGQLGDVTAADKRCTDAAQAANLDGPFVAYLSSTTSNVADRLAGSRGWKRRDGLPIADTVADLSVGLRHMLNLDEQSRRVADDAIIVTASHASGLLDTTLGTCGDWTVTDTSLTASGRSDVTSDDFADGGGFAECNVAAHLFCFGTSSDKPLEPVTLSGRIAFVSDMAWHPGGGRADADAHCMMEASAAQLPGLFLALLPTTTSTAAERFDLTGPPWVRVDGARIAATPSDLMTMQLDTTLNITPRGTQSNGFVWTSYYSLDATSVGQVTCNDWQSASTSVQGGLGDSRYASFLIDETDGGTGASCDQQYPLYCLEQ